MRLHRNGLATRLLGTALGVGFLVIGAYAVFGADETVGAVARERAFWFGVCALVGGIWAVGVSWLEPDLSGVWCRPPRAPRDLRFPKE